MPTKVSRTGRPFSDVKGDLKLLKRAYELRFRQRKTWKEIEQELNLKPTEGMTAYRCVEEYISLSKDPRVRAEGAEWTRQRRQKLRSRKSAAQAADHRLQALPSPALIEEQHQNLKRAKNIAAAEKQRVENLKQSLSRWLLAVDNATRELRTVLR